MANLSQEKRQRMLDFLNTIKDEHKNDDEVLKAIFEVSVKEFPPSIWIPTFAKIELSIKKERLVYLCQDYLRSRQHTGMKH